MNIRIPSVSVVVITFNRRDKLSQCLAALQHQSAKPNEIVVVLDGCTDGTADMLTKDFSHLPLNIIDKPNEGRSLSRNLGAKSASGNVLVFFDDDMVPHKECLEEHLNLVTSGKDTVSVGTQEEDPSHIRNDFDGFRHHVGLQWEEELSNEAKHSTYLTGANFCISKEAFTSLDGFDVSAEVIEDIDLGLRATARGMKLVYNPKARAWHDNRPDCKTYIRKQIEYHRSYINLLALHPEYLELSPAAALYRPDTLKRIVFNLVSRQFFVGLVDKDFFRYVLPKGIRYKFYDVLITGLSKVYPSRFNLQALQYHG